MSKQNPHSDQSGRAQRRREEQEVARAQRTVAQAPGMQLSVEKALAKIGVLTLERDALQQQVAQLVEALKSQAPTEPEVSTEEEEKDDPQL